MMGKKHIKKRRKIYAFLLALPPLIALVMVGITIFTNKAVIVAPEGLMLSPVKDTSPLILSLSIFIIGYLIFISMLFKNSIKNFTRLQFITIVPCFRIITEVKKGLKAIAQKP